MQTGSISISIVFQKSSWVNLSIFFFLFFSNMGNQVLSQSNEGTEFWFTFLEHRDQTNERVCMITSKNNASGLIEFPAIGWSQAVNIAANTVQIISIPAKAEMLTDEFIDETTRCLRFVSF